MLFLGVGAAAASLLASDKPEAWVEVTTPHFSVMCNDGDKTARRIADQFEQVRLLYSKALSRKLRLDPGIPIVIIATKNERSLSQIIPEYWAQKGHMHPSGVFMPSPERNYIALRTDVEGQFPYLIVYHEYVHLILNLNFQHLPLWLNEGFATFLGSATLLPKSARLGQPNESELRILSETKLLPLDVLFNVQYDSPYYNEAEKTNIFYAESWALVHYLMTNPERRKDQQLDKYLQLIDSGDDPEASAKAAFGDLGQLKKELDGYVFRTSYSMYVVNLPDPPDPITYSVRAVSRAEADATLGDFDVSRRQLDAARTKIEEAIRLDPNLAAPQESMALLLFRENKREEALKYFSRAVELDSKSALTYYYDGMLLLSDITDEEDPDAARNALEKAVALKPELAPAWDALAMLYDSDPDTYDKALSAAEHAVKAMPGDLRYQYNLAVVLMRMEKYKDARAIAQRISKSADPKLAGPAGELMDRIDRAEEYNSTNRERAAVPASSEGFGKPAGAGSSFRFKSGEESSAPAKSSSGEGALKPVPGAPVGVNSTHPYSMVGTMASVNCANAPQAQITLQAGALVMKLHATDFAKVELKLAAGGLSPENAACSELQGRKARISYQIVAGKAWDGEMVSIELQSTH
jgi:tetratricopeptide (TPR) repeat protein